MSYIRARTYCLEGLSAREISVETDIQRGLYHFSIIGMGDKAIEESRGRIQSAIKNSGFDSLKSVNQKITVLLAPASLKKEGSGFDLPIAISYLISAGVVGFDLTDVIFIGELSLSGDLRAPKNYLYLFREILEKDSKAVIVTSLECKNLCEYFIDRRIIYCKDLKEVCSLKKDAFQKAIGTRGIKTNLVEGNINLLENKVNLPGKYEALIGEVLIGKEKESAFDQISGCESAKRALAIAVAGRHNLLMVGPPGTGKTMLAKSIKEITSNLTKHESFECSALFQINNSQELTTPIFFPPFREPHHTSSYSSIIGDASLNAGEITKAHNGFLFLDELPEFDIRVIDSLREPLESGYLTLSKKKGSMTMPANFTLIANMNPCKCGYRGSSYKTCQCRPQDALRYAQKISGPMFDRFDMIIHIDIVENTSPSRQNKIEIKKQICRAINISTTRFKKVFNGIEPIPNGKLQLHDTNKNNGEILNLSKQAREALSHISSKMHLSKRGLSKISKVARTIADLDSSEEVSADHVYEAVSYRQ